MPCMNHLHLQVSLLMKMAVLLLAVSEQLELVQAGKLLMLMKQMVSVLSLVQPTLSSPVLMLGPWLLIVEYVEPKAS